MLKRYLLVVLLLSSTTLFCDQSDNNDGQAEIQKEVKIESTKNTESEGNKGYSKGEGAYEIIKNSFLSETNRKKANQSTEDMVGEKDKQDLYSYSLTYIANYELAQSGFSAKSQTNDVWQAKVNEFLDKKSDLEKKDLIVIVRDGYYALVEKESKDAFEKDKQWAEYSYIGGAVLGAAVGVVLAKAVIIYANKLAGNS